MGVLTIWHTVEAVKQEKEPLSAKVNIIEQDSTLTTYNLTTISMTEAIESFPFRRPVRKVSQKDRTQKKVFVLGVYASAVHAQ
jgi:hypothetical protein